jgi:ParB-like chromosome segregation protein Spo0J
MGAKTLRITRRGLDELVPAALNARTHSDAQIAAIAASIREFGWTVPVLVDSDGTIIAGHGRVAAARKLGIERVPCIALADLTAAQARAYRIADNQLAAAAGWDEAALEAEIAQLAEAEFDLGTLGFSPARVDELLAAGDFAPEAEAGQGRLDQTAPQRVACPHCGAVFDAKDAQAGADG